MTWVVLAVLLSALANPRAAGAAPSPAAQDAAGDSTGSVFPFRPTCQSTESPYKLAPLYKSLGNGKYCFTINVTPQGCRGPCCTSDLKKIEFNVSASCMVSPAAEVKATINGRPTSIGAAYYKAGPPGNAVLRLTSLGLDLSSAANASLCLTLKLKSVGKGCDTLQKMCVPPAGAPPGTCLAAFEDSSCKCCGNSTTSTASPPPPPSPRPRPPPPSPRPPPRTPPSPRPPPPSPRPSPPRPPSPWPLLPPTPSFPPPGPFSLSIPACQVCIKMEVTATIPGLGQYQFDSNTCKAIQQQIVDSMNTLARAAGFNLSVPFKYDSDKCTPAAVGSCGTFRNSTQGASLEKQVDQLLSQLLDSVTGGDVCSPQWAGSTLKVSVDNENSAQTNTTACLQLVKVQSCKVPGTPFVNCSCNTTQGILPYAISPTFTIGNTGRDGTEYCFGVTTLNTTIPSTCGDASDVMDKVEWWANRGLSVYVRGIRLYSAKGTVTNKAPVWGSLGTNQLRATNISWTKADAKGGRICVLVRQPVTMSDVCLGIDGQCDVGIFNMKSCCPVYRISPGVIP